MRTVTNVIMAIDMFLITVLVTIQIGCMSTVPVTTSDVNASVENSPAIVITNRVDERVVNPAFNLEDYVWDNWELRERNVEDVR